MACCIHGLPTDIEYRKIHDRRAIIISSENNVSHKYHNAEKLVVCQFKYDDLVETNGKACDYLVVIEELSQIYIIELKGHNIDEAVVQVLESFERIKGQFDGFDFKIRIVAAKVSTPEILTSKYKTFLKWLEKRGIDYRLGSKVLEN